MRGLDIVLHLPRAARMVRAVIMQELSPPAIVTLEKAHWYF
jgi:hypothetical protein